MDKLTSTQIIEILNEKISEENFGYGEFVSKEIGLGESEDVFEERTGGDYDVMMKVVHFKDHDVYISLTGYYASHSGTEWDGEYKEVFPKTKTITVYEEKK